MARPEWAKCSSSSSHRAPCQQCGLTPRSSGAPTAGHQARSGGTRYIFASPGLASCRCHPLSSNVRPRRNAPRHHCRTLGARRVRQVHPSAVEARTMIQAAECHVEPEDLASITSGTAFARANTHQGLQLSRASAALGRLENGPSAWAPSSRLATSGATSPRWAKHRRAGTRFLCSPGCRAAKQGQWFACRSMSNATGTALGGQAGPNPSLKRSANGGPPGPRGAVVYLAPRGPGVPPLAPA